MTVEAATAEGQGDEHSHLLTDALRAFVHEQLESYKVPRTIILLDSLPRTHLGKVDRGRLRAGDRGIAE